MPQRCIQVGMDVADLETPILIISLDAMERNLARMMETIDGSGIRLRPHLKTTKSPALAKVMIDAGAIGICVSKLSEAESMAEAGINDILLTSEVAGIGKFERLVTLAGQYAGFKCVVDNTWTIKEIAKEAQKQNVVVNVLIELNVGANRTGVETKDEALLLADQILKCHGVELVGVQGYAGQAQRLAEDKADSVQRAMDLIHETVELLLEHNHNINIISGGGTGTSQLDSQNRVLTELQAGSFLLMDSVYRDAGAPFETALTCQSTIISRPTPTRAVCDAGQKTLSNDQGLPIIDRAGLKYLRGSDEHGAIHVTDEGLSDGVRIGDVISIIPSHVCTTINLHDIMIGEREGKVESVFPIVTRGHVW